MRKKLKTLESRKKIRVVSGSEENAVLKPCDTSLSCANVNIGSGTDRMQSDKKIRKDPFDEDILRLVNKHNKYRRNCKSLIVYSSVLASKGNRHFLSGRQSSSPNSVDNLTLRKVCWNKVFLELELIVFCFVLGTINYLVQKF